MIIGIGNDIVEIERVRRAVASEHFTQRVFTETEIKYCESRGKQSAASYAARFAAKEAFFKAIGTGIFSDLTEVEIVNDSNGKPEIFLHGKVKSFADNLGVKNIFLSMSHSKNYAVANVLIDG